MLTCKVGEKIINCFDGIYDKFQLKKWSDKDILICPDCSKPYEYCHGQIIPPYFRHKEKNKDCESIYSESETAEHLNGKKLLYNRLLKVQEQGIIRNIKLEAYIPETKQRPDLYFESIDNKRYVVEFQCTPIASEYLERHELYQLANINDIWILGLDKYNLNIDDNIITHKASFKTIEKHIDYYLDTKTSNIVLKKNAISKYLPYNKLKLNQYYLYKLNEISLDIMDNIFCIKINNLQDFLLEDEVCFKEFQKENQDKIDYNNKSKSLEPLIKEIIDLLNNKCINIPYEFDYKSGNHPYYLNAIKFLDNSYEFFGKTLKFMFFIKEKSVDCCEQDTVSVPFRGKRGGTGWRKEQYLRNIDTFEYESVDKQNITSFILKYTSSIIENKLKEYNTLQLYKDTFKDFADKEIYLINSGEEKVPDNIRFKFLKGFSIKEDYMLKTFIEELKFLKRKNVDKYIFMIPKYHSYFNTLGFNRYVRVGDLNYKILEHFKKFGFTNIKYLDY